MLMLSLFVLTSQDTNLEMNNSFDTTYLEGRSHRLGLLALAAWLWLLGRLALCGSVPASRRWVVRVLLWDVPIMVPDGGAWFGWWCVA